MIAHGLHHCVVPIDHAPLTSDGWRYAEALAIEKLHGPEAPRWIADRIGALAQAGDAAGVERFHEIAACFERMLTARYREQ